jgi:hypothetical protein
MEEHPALYRSSGTESGMGHGTNDGASNWESISAHPYSEEIFWNERVVPLDNWAIATADWLPTPSAS